MIKKVRGGYKVLSEDGKKNLGGPYKSKAAAEAAGMKCRLRGSAKARGTLIVPRRRSEHDHAVAHAVSMIGCSTRSSCHLLLSTCAPHKTLAAIAIEGKAIATMERLRSEIPRIVCRTPLASNSLRRVLMISLTLGVSTL